MQEEDKVNIIGKNVSSIFRISEHEQNIRKKPDWTYLEDPFKDSGTSIRLAHQAYQKNDSRFLDTIQNQSHNIVTKSKSMFEFAKDINFDSN